MIKFVFFVCALAAVSASYHENENKYHGPQHHPIITKQGVPLETPEVRDAKIHHHIAHEVADHGNVKNLYNDYENDQHRYSDSDNHGYHGPKHYPIITKQGVPLETPEVRDAKIHHHIAHEAAAYSQINYGYGSGSEYSSNSANRYSSSSASEHNSGSANGYSSVYSSNSGNIYGHDYGYHKYAGAKHYPVITKQGVPLETPEVRDAKLHHHIAHEVAAHGQHDDVYEGHHDGDASQNGHASENQGKYTYGYQIVHPLTNYDHHRVHHNTYY